MQEFWCAKYSLRKKYINNYKKMKKKMEDEEKKYIKKHTIKM